MIDARNKVYITARSEIFSLGENSSSEWNISVQKEEKDKNKCSTFVSVTQTWKTSKQQTQSKISKSKLVDQKQKLKTAAAGFYFSGLLTLFSLYYELLSYFSAELIEDRFNSGCLWRHEAESLLTWRETFLQISKITLLTINEIWINRHFQCKFQVFHSKYLGHFTF